MPQVLEKAKKREWKKERIEDKKEKFVEKTVGKSITDQTGAMDKADLVYALQTGAIVKTNPMEYGKQQNSVDMAEALDNALVESYAEFETSVYPAIEENIEKLREQKRAQLKEDKVEVPEVNNDVSGAEGGDST
jgi:hypothetical protein